MILGLVFLKHPVVYMDSRHGDIMSAAIVKFH